MTCAILERLIRNSCAPSKRKQEVALLALCPTVCVQSMADAVYIVHPYPTNHAVLQHLSLIRLFNHEISSSDGSMLQCNSTGSC